MIDRPISLEFKLKHPYKSKERSKINAEIQNHTYENTAYAKNKSKEAVEIGSVIKHTCVLDTRSVSCLCIYLNMHVGPNITCSSYLCRIIKPSMYNGRHNEKPKRISVLLFLRETNKIESYVKYIFNFISP